MNDEEIIKLQRKLKKIMSKDGKGQEQALDILKKLDDANITIETLAKTKLGIMVNDYRKFSQDEQVKSFGRQLVKKWKNFIPAIKNDESKNVVGCKGTKKIEEKKGQQVNEEGNDKKKVNQKKKENHTTHNNNNNYSSQLGNHNYDSTDQVRAKCTQMIINALNVDKNNEDCTNSEQLAEELENAIYEQFKDTGIGYKNRVRSRASNLKDTKNPNLRNSFRSGAITAVRLAVMSHEDMASDELKLLKKSYTKEGIRESRLAMSQGTTTDLLQCGKCKKRNCTYSQLQTRSADEPMTTFVGCNECGNRWKF